MSPNDAAAKRALSLGQKVRNIARNEGADACFMVLITRDGRGGYKIEPVGYSETDVPHAVCRSAVRGMAAQVDRIEPVPTTEAELRDGLSDKEKLS